MLERPSAFHQGSRVESSSPVVMPACGFATTRWSLILKGPNPGECSSISADLAELCQIYWRPIFTYICRRGYTPTDAQDLTQDFFVKILEGRILDCADPHRGRFRCFLIKSLKNFLINAEVRRHRHKRGGNVQFVSWEQWMENTPSQLRVPESVQSCSPEVVFDMGWAATVAEQAFCRLRLECEGAGRRRIFDVLRDYITAERGDISYQSLSKILGLRPPAVKKLMYAFRKRLRCILHELIADTIEDPDDVEDEVRYLCAALSMSSN